MAAAAFVIALAKWKTLGQFMLIAATLDYHPRFGYQSCGATNWWAAVCA